MGTTNGIKVTDKIKYIIGIDFGHGETSAAVCNLDENDNPHDIEFQGKYSIPTAIYAEKTTENGNQKFSLGHSAFAKINSGESGQFDSYFKDSPNNMNDEQKKSLKLFFKAVYDHIKKSLQLGEDDHAVFIACPSNSDRWNEGAKHDYLQLALDAGLPVINDNYSGYSIEGIIRESRAAYIQILKEKTNRGGVLVIDFGSSTIDITYHEGEGNPIDKSYQNGAQWVETAILKSLEKDVSEGDNIKRLEKYEHGYEGAKFEIRKSKERFYQEECTSELQFSLNYKALSRKQMNVDTYRGFLVEKKLNKLLEPYMKQIHESFKDFKDTCLENKNIALLVITGGASRMPFIKDIAKNEFGIEAADDKAPSLTVSRGIASAGKIDIKLFRLFQNLVNREVENFEGISSVVYESAAGAIAESMLRIIDNVYNSFKESVSYLQTINELESEIKSKINRNAHIIEGELNVSFSEQLESHVAKVKDTFSTYIKQFFPDFENRNIKTPQLNSNAQIKLSIEQTNSFSELILNSTIAMGEKGLEAAAKVIYNLGIAIPIGLAATLIEDAFVVIHNGVKRLIKWVKDEEYDELVDGLEYADAEDNIDAFTWDFRDKNSILDSRIKERVAIEYESKKGDFKSKLIKDIIEQFNNDSELKKEIETACEKCTREYILSETKRVRAQLK